ncbi:MAG TPA: protein kinase [Bryobacteraceae bacterium]|nr:protein kinase [Bryobacteraceae bacterium]
MIGTRIAHYTVTGALGKGGMGVVYEAKDHHLDRLVALKLLLPESTVDPSRRQRFIQEAKSASALNHPGIVTVYEIGVADGFEYIAMELVRGRTLEQVLLQGPMAFNAAMKVANQIADAMGAAHTAGIVHRDLKPGNIMINERGDVKVLDFGLAKLTEHERVSPEQSTLLMAHAATKQGVLLGTGPYMSPEQVEGRKVDGRSDIFSFGAVLYEITTGKCVFARPSLVATLAAVLKDDPPPPSVVAPALPKDFDRLISKCLHKDPLHRTQTMAQIQEDIRAFQNSVARPAPTVLAARLWRRSTYYLVAGALLLIAVAWMVRAVLEERRSAPSYYRPTILTSFTGYQGEPNLSPDGNQLAFDWDGDSPDRTSHVYLSLLGKGSPLRITPETVDAVEPAWSPDGQSIAYLRETQPGSDKVELVVRPALGGVARILVTGIDFDGSAPTWSPDARWLVWSQGKRVGTLWSIPAEGGDPHQITDARVIKGGDDSPAISPDGHQIAFVRGNGDFDLDLFIADFEQGRIKGSPRQLTSEHEIWGNPVWSEDGRNIFYVNGSTFGSEPSIRRISVSGGMPKVLEGIGQNAVRLAYSPKAHRLVYSTSFTNYDIRRLDLKNLPSKPQRFLSSNRFDSSAIYSPDGKRIAFDSNRSGSREIWVANADGSEAAPVTSFGRGVTGSGQWSPDGKYLVFDARPDADADVYIVASSGGPVKKLTDYRGEDHNARFSPDGKWIYFASRRSGGHEIFRMHLDGSGVEQMTHNGGILPMFGQDGKWLYYSVASKGIWKMPMNGGTPVQALDARVSTYGYTITSKGIYAASKTREGAYEVALYSFEGSKKQTLLTLDRVPYMFLSVSPDERYLLYTTPDDPVYEMMLVENFR